MMNRRFKEGFDWAFLFSCGMCSVLLLPLLIVVVLIILMGLMGASYRTPNFVVETPDQAMAQEFGQRAEALRAELAQQWLGRTLEQWSRPCPVTVEVGNQTKNSQTTFVFGNGEVFNWRMRIQGPRERVMDSILPHEITHMVLASHFRRPLPRWADEGAAIASEYAGEQERHRLLLVGFLRARRGIAFRRMFSMMKYPRDIFPLYAEGWSLCDFLIRRGGRRRFINYLRDGLVADQWDQATNTHYGINNLGELQTAWVASVEAGTHTVASGYG